MGTENPFDLNVEQEDIPLAPILDHLQHVHNTLPVPKSGCETWACAWNLDGSIFAWLAGHRIVKLMRWDKELNALENHYSDDHEPVSIDTGEIVWSVSFGRLVCKIENLNSAFVFRRQLSVPLDRGVEVIALGLAKGRIRLCEVNTGKLFMDLQDHKDVVKDVKFAPVGSYRLASCSRDGTVKLWDLLDGGNMYKTLKPRCNWVHSVAWSPCGILLAASGDTRQIIVWNSWTFETIHKISGHAHDVSSVNFSPDGALLVSTSYDTQAIVWDTSTGEQLANLKHLLPEPSSIFAGGANRSYVRKASLSSDGTHIATVCDDGYVRLWDLEFPSVPESIGIVPNALCCAFSPGGKVLAVGNRNGEVVFYEAPQYVSSLQHLCRMSVRKVISSAHIVSLNLPKRIKKFLRYIAVGVI